MSEGDLASEHPRSFTEPWRHTIGVRLATLPFNENPGGRRPQKKGRDILGAVMKNKNTG